jgi:hypothetical protein
VASSAEREEALRAIADLGLSELGYLVRVRKGRRGEIVIDLQHPLRGPGTYGFAFETAEAGWPDKLHAEILAWPDLELARRADDVRPTTVPLLGAVRHAELEQLFLLRSNSDATKAAVDALRSFVTALASTTSLLSRQEVNWLYRAFESDALEVYDVASGA